MARPPKPEKPPGVGWDWKWNGNKWIRVEDPTEGHAQGNPGGYAPSNWHGDRQIGSGEIPQGESLGPETARTGGAGAGNVPDNPGTITGNVGGSVSFNDPRTGQSGTGSLAAPYSSSLGTGAPDPRGGAGAGVNSYAGGIGTPPPGTTFGSNGEMILPPGWSAIGGAGDQGPPTYVNVPTTLPDGSPNPAFFAIVEAVKGNNYTGDPTDYAPGGSAAPGTGGGTSGGTSGGGTSGGASGGGFTSEQNSLLANIRSILAQVGLDTPGLIDLATSLIARGRTTSTEIMIELRQHQDYLANPLFAANLERTKQGKGFRSEGEVLAWASEARRLAKQYGYTEPSNNYLAEGLRSGLSMAEIEHRFQIQDRINLYGAGVMSAAKEMGFDVDDADLFEVFDPEKDTKEWEDMFRRAQMSGRPVALGLGRRGPEEVRFAEMMGLTADEYYSRMETVAGNRSRFERLGAIEEQVRQGLPNDFGSHLMTADNGLLIQALVFQRPDALAKLQDMTAREIARFKGTGGAAGMGTGLQAMTSR